MGSNTAPDAANAGEHKSGGVRVAIVGGGCAGLAAAWELSRLNLQPDAPLRYDITLYERSARLGGKGASGRDAHGRIREHGLHIWLGFYENAFRMMRECYREAEQAGFGPRAQSPDDMLAHASFDDAFMPEAHVGVATPDRSGAWEAWTGLLPPMKGEPGTPLDEDTNPFTLTGYLRRCLALTQALMHSVIGPAGGEAKPGEPRPDGRSAHDQSVELDFATDPMQSASTWVGRMASWLRVGMLTTAAGLLHGAALVESWLRERNPAPQWDSTILAFLEALATHTRRQLRDLVEIDPHLRRKTEIIDLIYTIVVGLYRDRVLFDARGLDAINHIDCQAWLRQHGALESSVKSPFVTGLYDLAFCYRNGDRSQPALAAGQALRGALRMFFTYRGSLFWRMRSGMGDTVFAPLYRVLARRGVRFCFRHALTAARFALEENADRRLVALDFDVRDMPEEPLDHFGCWPYVSEHDAGPAKKLPLRDGEHFDAVVMALGIDDFSQVCKGPFFEQQPRWERMRQHVKTIGTQAAQVWLGDDLETLGWRRGPVLLSGAPQPLETWADMTHTLASERAWRRHAGRPETDAVRSIAYFCGVLPDKQIIAAADADPDADADAKRAVQGQRLTAQVRGNLEALLRGPIRAFWPDCEGGDGRPLSALLGEDGQQPAAASSTAERIGAQHVQANWLGSERYTLALPGSLEHRISPLDDSIVNMTIAGDWTECGFNEGCVEAAVMSGMLAAHAISGAPDLNDIVGYHHP